MSQIPLFEAQGRQTFEGGHELFGHRPFAWKIPTPPGGLKRLIFVLFSLPELGCISWAIPPVRLGLSGRNSGKTPEMLSERFLEFPSRVRLGCPKPYNSRHLRLPERLQNSLPPSTAGDASFFRIGSGEGLSEPVMEFPAVLGVFLISSTLKITMIQKFGKHASARRVSNVGASAKCTA